MSADLCGALAASFARIREEQRRRDSLPCPSCGGDRLRPDFVTPGRCHVLPTKEGDR